MLISRWSHWIAIYSLFVDTDIYQGQRLDGQATQENDSKGSDVDNEEKAAGESVKDSGPEQEEKTNGETLKMFH